jgi:hypothetical protein
MHSIVDVQGFFAPEGSAPSGALYTPITPTRTMDTRILPYCTPEGTCFPAGQQIPGGTEVAVALEAPVDAIAAIANITIQYPPVVGYLSADDCNALDGSALGHSNLNFGPGDVVANLALSPTLNTSEGEQFCTVSARTLSEIIDVQGWFAPAAEGGLGYNSMTPDRLVDTRQCWTDPVTDVERCGQLVAGGEVMHFEAPADAKAVAINITTVSSPEGGYVSAGPCSEMTAGVPPFSNVNAVDGSAVANSAIVPVDPDGTFCLYVSRPMNIIVDLMGTFEDTGLQFIAITPTRVHDSRAHR